MHPEQGLVRLLSSMSSHDVMFQVTNRQQVSHLDWIRPGKDLWADDTRPHPQQHRAREDDPLGYQGERRSSGQHATAQGYVGQLWG